MKERPILFSAPMVRAILDGSKTQTRRVVKLLNGQYMPPSRAADINGWNQMLRLCPYGQPGDRLWVREAFLGWYKTADKSFSHVAAYRADGYELEAGERWTPSIHMPRAASRITLEVTGVRVDRLQDISEEDARAEGITDGGCLNCGNPETDCGCLNPQPDARDSFVRLWQSINGPESWGANPWVWVVEFKRLEGVAA